MKNIFILFNLVILGWGTLPSAFAKKHAQFAFDPVLQRFLKAEPYCEEFLQYASNGFNIDMGHSGDRYVAAHFSFSALLKKLHSLVRAALQEDLALIRYHTADSPLMAQLLPFFGAYNPKPAVDRQSWPIFCMGLNCGTLDTEIRQVPFNYQVVDFDDPQVDLSLLPNVFSKRPSPRKGLVLFQAITMDKLSDVDPQTRTRWLSKAFRDVAVFQSHLFLSRWVRNNLAIQHKEPVCPYFYHHVRVRDDGIILIDTRFYWTYIISIKKHVEYLVEGALRAGRNRERLFAKKAGEALQEIERIAGEAAIEEYGLGLENVLEKGLRMQDSMQDTVEKHQPEWSLPEREAH